MKINVICPDCSAQQRGSAVFFIETIREDGLYTGQCPKGHQLMVATQTLPHEMLFEIALNAIRDGYFREAVASFASSVERFFEFSLRVIADRNKVKDDLFELAWKKITSQSERQLGAFVMQYTNTFFEMPALLSQNMVELRNNVVHKGNLPDRGEAVAFGGAAYEVILPGVVKLRSACLDNVNNTLGKHVGKIAAKMGSTYPRAFQVTPTALNIIQDTSKGYKPFEAILEEYGLK